MPLLARALVLAGLLFAATATDTAAAQQVAPAAADSAAIRATVLDYVDGWYEGDGPRMRRSLHPELAKRIARVGGDGTAYLQPITADELAAAAAGGGGRQTPEAERERDVRILDVFENSASVRATMAGWVDYMHLARVDGRWVIVNVLWELKPRG
jgi:hypothetical protein